MKERTIVTTNDQKAFMFMTNLFAIYKEVFKYDTNKAYNAIEDILYSVSAETLGGKRIAQICVELLDSSKNEGKNEIKTSIPMVKKAKKEKK